MQVALIALALIILLPAGLIFLFAGEEGIQYFRTQPEQKTMSEEIADLFHLATKEEHTNIREVFENTPCEEGEFSVSCAKALGMEYIPEGWGEEDFNYYYYVRPVNENKIEVCDEGPETGNCIIK